MSNEKFRELNAPRVAKMVQTVDLIRRSGASQRADRDEVGRVLRPLRAALEDTDCAVPAEPLRPEPVVVDVAPRWDPARFPQMVRDLSPKEFHSLIIACAIRNRDDLADEA